MDDGKVVINAKRKVNGEWVDIDIDEIDWENINEIHVKGKYHYFRNQWIPVTERLPNHELALVQYSDGDFDLLQFPTAYRMKDIVAWLPMPKAYKGGEKDEVD